MIKKLRDGVKVLGDGELTKALTVRAHKFSAQGPGEGSPASAARPKSSRASATRRVDRCCRASGTSGTSRTSGRGCCSPSACWPSTAWATTSPRPGINAQALIDFFEQNRANWFGLVDMFSGGNLAQGHRLRARDHAVHLGLDHPAAPHRGLALPGEAVQGRRARPPQDHPVHALRHGAALDRAVAGHRRLPGADDAQPAVPDRREPRASASSS